MCLCPPLLRFLLPGLMLNTHQLSKVEFKTCDTLVPSSAIAASEYIIFRFQRKEIKEINTTIGLFKKLQNALTRTALV